MRRGSVSIHMISDQRSRFLDGSRTHNWTRNRTKCKPEVLLFFLVWKHEDFKVFVNGLQSIVTGNPSAQNFLAKVADAPVAHTPSCRHLRCHGAGAICDLERRAHGLLSQCLLL